MFVQVGCLVPEEDLASRIEKGLVLGCAAVFIALFVVNYLDYIKKVQQNNYVEWDLKTITSGDFAIEFDLDPTFFSDYLEKEHDNWVEEATANGKGPFMSRVQAFQAYMKHEMERRLEQMPDLGFDDEPTAHVDIAVTSLAFNNAGMINLLRERGAAIKAEKWELQKEIEVKINALKSAEFEKLTTPCSVFMTFATEEGVNRALAYDEAIKNDENLAHLKHWVGEHEIEVQAASEPSDIIWENRHFTPNQRMKKSIVVYLIITILLLASFVVIFIFSNISAAALAKYPVIADCSAQLVNYDDPAFMQSAAWLEYRTNSALEASGKAVAYTGYVQCFCDDRAAAGDETDALYKASETTKELPVCQDYFDSAFTTLILTNGIMVVIIAINYILKSLTISLITWIGYDTHSELMTKITNGVFVALFFNTGILLLLTNANLSDVSSWLSSVFSGTYYDYSPQWYATVGSTLVSTMLLNAFMPPLYEAMANAQVWLFKTMDNGWRCRVKEEDRRYFTKTT